MTLIELLEDIVVIDDNGNPVKVPISNTESLVPRIDLFSDSIGVYCWVTYSHQEDKNQILEQIITSIPDVPDHLLTSVAQNESKLLCQFSKINFQPEAV